MTRFLLLAACKLMYSTAVADVVRLWWACGHATGICWLSWVKQFGCVRSCNILLLLLATWTLEEGVETSRAQTIPHSACHAQ